MKRILLLFLILIQVSCMGKDTTDPVKAFKYWAGVNPSKEIQVLHGKYLQSAHWSKEYVLYFEMIVTSEWIENFIKENKLIEEKNYNERHVNDAPDPTLPSWFSPDKSFRTFELQQNSSAFSILFIDPVNPNHIFLYEQQL